MKNKFQIKITNDCFALFEYLLDLCLKFSISENEYFTIRITILFEYESNISFLFRIFKIIAERKLDYVLGKRNENNKILYSNIPCRDVFLFSSLSMQNSYYHLKCCNECFISND